MTASFEGDHENFHILKEYLKKTDSYDSHVLQSDQGNVKLVKISKEAKLNKYDVNLYLLKQKLKSLTQIIKE